MKILVVTLSNLGDVILTLPVLQALTTAYPKCQLDVVTGEAGRQVLQNDPRVHELIPYNKKSGFFEKCKFLTNIRKRRYDLIVDLRRSWIGFLGGSKKRNSYFYLFPKKKHQALKHLEALKNIVNPEILDRGSWFGQASRYTDSAKHFWNRWAEEPKLPYLVAAIGSKSDVKKWPPQKFAELLWMLGARQKYSVILVGDSRDGCDAQTVKDKIRTLSESDPVTVYNLAGETQFEELAGILKKAALVITNDSAPLHLADALNVPVLALFGPTDPVKYGPRQKQSTALSLGLFCQPCEKAQCRFHHECLKNLEVSQVYSKAVEILESKKLAVKERILVIRLDRMGDLAVSVPALKLLRGRFPQAHITLMTRPYTKELLEGQLFLDEVIAYDYKKQGKHAFGLGYFRMIKEISARRFDVSVIMHPGIRSYLIPFLAGIPKRVGYWNRHAWLLTDTIKDLRHLGLKHESEYALELCRILTRDQSVPLDLEPELISVEPVFAARVLQEFLGVSSEHDLKFISVHAGASCVSKRWPKESFRVLIERLLQEYSGRIVVVGATQEMKLSNFLVQGLGGRVVDLTGKLSLKQLTALLSKSELLVSNDSGPAHVAAMTGTPVLSLFGRNQAGLSAHRWRPLGKSSQVVWKNAGCVVCLAHNCTIDFECLKLIKVEEVMNKVNCILQTASAK